MRGTLMGLTIFGAFGMLSTGAVAQVAPAQGTPDQGAGAPIQVAPDQTQIAPTQVAPTQVAPTQVAPDQGTPDQWAGAPDLVADDLKALSLEDLLNLKVSTVSKSEEEQLTAPATVYVVTEKDIQRYGFRDLKDILQMLPNFDNYFQGAKVDGSARGFEGILDQVTYLINGREFVENRTQQAWIQDHSMPAGIIKRVEVVMGPMATLYGAHSMQGVINVVLKTEDASQPTGGFLGTSYANGDRRFIEGLYRHRSDGVEVGLAFTKYTSVNAFGRYSDFNRDPFFSRSPTLDAIRRTDRFTLGDDQQTLNAYVGIGHARGPAGVFYGGYNYWESQGQFGMDNPQYDNIANQYNGRNRMPFLGWRKEIGDNMAVRAEGQYLEDRVLVRFPSGDGTDMNPWHQASYDVQGKRYTGTTQFNGRFLENRLSLVAGLDYTHRDVGPAKVREYFVVPLANDENNISLRIKMNSVSGFVQGDWNPLRFLKVDYGLRVAKEDFATLQLLNHAALVFSPFSGSAFKAIFSEGFRPPAFIDLANNSNQGAVSPMKMRNYELNYSQQLQRGSFQIYNSASAYYMVETNRFTIARNSAGGNGFLIQTVPGDYNVAGFEDMVRAVYQQVSGFASVRWVSPDAEEVSKVTTSMPYMNMDPATVAAGHLKQVPAVRIKAGAAVDIRRHFGVAGWINYFSDTTVAAPKLTGAADGYQVYTVPAVAVVNLNFWAGGFKYGQCEINSNLMVENVLNTRYYDPYPSQGQRWAIVQSPRIIQLRGEIKF
jgi:hypothetical protein